MIKLQDLPEEIKASLEKYIGKRETVTVFPSMLKIDEKDYYYFVFTPAGHHLIMETNGHVPYHEERIALIANDFNHTLESLDQSASMLTNTSFEENYKKLRNLLLDVETKIHWLPEDISRALKVFQNAVLELIRDHGRLTSIVKEMIRIWEETEKRELVTEEDQMAIRKLRIKVATLAYKQNKLKVETRMSATRSSDMYAANGLVHQRFL